MAQTPLGPGFRRDDGWGTVIPAEAGIQDARGVEPSQISGSQRVTPECLNLTAGNAEPGRDDGWGAVIPAEAGIQDARGGEPSQISGARRVTPECLNLTSGNAEPGRDDDPGRRFGLSDSEVVFG